MANRSRRLFLKIAVTAPVATLLIPVAALSKETKIHQSADDYQKWFNGLSEAEKDTVVKAAEIESHGLNPKKSSHTQEIKRKDELA
jgi:hypothetical protein